jgi:hypothetical protein
MIALSTAGLDQSKLAPRGVFRRQYRLCRHRRGRARAIAAWRRSAPGPPWCCRSPPTTGRGQRGGSDALPPTLKPRERIVTTGAPADPRDLNRGAEQRRGPARQDNRVTGQVTPRERAAPPVAARLQAPPPVAHQARPQAPVAGPCATSAGGGAGSHNAPASPGRPGASPAGACSAGPAPPAAIHNGGSTTRRRGTTQAAKITIARASLRCRARRPAAANDAVVATSVDFAGVVENILRVLPALHRLRCALAEENAAHRRDGSNLDCVRKERVTPFVKRPHKIRLGMDCLTFAIKPLSSVGIERKCRM